MKRIYIDSNILIAYYSTDKPEESKKQLVQHALDVLATLKDTQLCTSMWAVTEMVNVLVSSKKLEPGVVAQMENRLTNEKRFGKLKLTFLDVSPVTQYDFAEFFYHVRQGVLNYHSGVGNVIHSVIMNNNGIDSILTFDEKDDFKKIPDLTVLHPKDIKLPG